MEYFEFYSEVKNLFGELKIKHNCSNTNFEQYDEYCSVVDVYIKNQKIHFAVETDGEIGSDTDICMETIGIFEIEAPQTFEIEINQKSIKAMDKVLNGSTVDVSKINLKEHMAVDVDISTDVDAAIRDLEKEVTALTNDTTAFSNNMMDGFSKRELMRINNSHVNYYGYDDAITVVTERDGDHKESYKLLRIKKSALRTLYTTRSIINFNIKQ